jgi:hypothetical protein
VDPWKLSVRFNLFVSNDVRSEMKASATTSLSASASASASVSASAPMIRQRLQQSRDYNTMQPKKNLEQRTVAREATSRR